MSTLNRHHRSEPVFSFCTLALTTLLLSACGGGGGGDSANGGSKDVEQALNALGVSTEATPRVADDKAALPDDYSPLRSTQTIDAFMEVFMVGIPLAASFGVDNPVAVVEQVVDGNNQFASELLLAPASADTPWVLSDGEQPAQLRAVTTADVDGDGLQELLVCYRLAGEQTVQLQIIDDLENGFTFLPPITISNLDPQEIQIAAGDFNGNGRMDVVVGLSLDTGAQLLWLENSADGGLGLSDASLTLSPISGATELSLAMAVGNLDYDNPDELVVVLNEYFTQDSGTNPDTGISRYFVFDDANAGYTELDSGAITGFGATINHTAITATVALGDIDGDNVDEIVFGGLTNFAPTLQCEYGYLLAALDDLKHDFAPLGADYREPFRNDPDWQCAPTPLRLRHLHINTLDLDQDGADEIQANQFLFEDFRTASPWSLRDTLPKETLFRTDGNGDLTGDFNRHNSSITVGDVTSDKRDNVLVYSQQGEVAVWGLDSLQNEWQQMGSIATQAADPDDKQRPLVIPANVDYDSLVLQYSAGEYKLVFTEPVIVAALAAAPCARNLGQNEDACRTGFGTAESNTTSIENTFTVTAGVSLGFSASFSALGVEVSDFEAIASVKASLAQKSIESYTLTTRIEYESGPIEDTVIFTSIPYDQYTYQILSHPNPKYIGVEIVLSMPRSPIKILANRDFYNQNIAADGIPIDGSIFAHRAGDPQSYPTASEKDDLLNRYRGFETAQVDVGQGGGSVGVGINIFNETGTGTTYGVEAEFELQATIGGVVGGFSIGGGTENSLQISHGQESDYSGTVANLSAEHFASNSYSFGLFTYIYKHPQQPFEVINYWVE
ncbi:MAG: VCBS repeat-containing protein [Gammaproteobacteria bacterium]|nr:VCBS repeat-containing protein [Gammaproteobacteria bacterium]